MRTSARKQRSGYARAGSDRGQGLPWLLPDRSRHGEVRAQQGILCQGRGSAANSVVCYVLGITAVDPIAFKLPFERFLSATRDEPDIDVDFDSDRREVIQEVYRRYGRRNAAQVARDQLSAEVGGSRHGEGARLLHRTTGRLVQADRLLGDAPDSETDRGSTATSAAPASCWTTTFQIKLWIWPSSC